VLTYLRFCWRKRRLELPRAIMREIFDEAVKARQELVRAGERLTPAAFDEALDRCAVEVAGKLLGDRFVA
jgi:hypothetical protein